jgi:signal transduction histidine kinase
MSHKRSTSKTKLLSLSRTMPLGELLSLGAQLNADVTPATLFREVTEAIDRVLRFRRVYVRLRNVETDELEAVAFAGLSNEAQDALKASPTAPAVYQALLQEHFRQGDLYYIPHAAGVTVEPALPQLGEAAPTGERWHPDDVLLAPLRGRGDRLLGIIYLAAPHERQVPSDTTLQMVAAIARQAALALENARLYARTARLLVKEQLLAELSRDVSTTLDLPTILERTTMRLQTVFESGAVALLDATGQLVITAQFGPDSVTRPAALRTVATHALSQGAALLANGLLLEELQGTRAAVAAPLWAGGRIIGVLLADDADPERFTYEDVDLLEAVASQVAGPLLSAHLYQQERRRSHQLTVLNTIASTAAAAHELEALLDAVTGEIQRGFGYDNVQLFLLDEQQQELTLSAQAGELMIVGGQLRRPLHEGLIGRSARSGLTVRVDDVAADPDFVRSPLAHTRSELCVPVRATGRVLAVLNLESAQLHAFTQDDVAVLETAADVLAGAIENILLHRRSQEAAVLEERTRLARDLHDSVTQQLFSITLTAQAARAQVEKRPERAMSQLERVQETASAALSEMRALIFQLRPPAALEQGLVPALQQHIAAVRRRDMLPIELRVEGEGRLAHRVEQGLYRIVQEALNNVARHAGECYVVVSVVFLPELVRLEVEDTGCGFDAALVPLQPREAGRRLGLVSMRERASELGASLVIDSHPGQGTRVVVELPRS